MRSPRAAWVFAAVVVTAACGDAARPPAAPSGESAGGPPDSGHDLDEATHVRLGGGDPDGSATAKIAGTSDPPPPPEPADECTPVGVDFEKRVRPKLKDCYQEGKKKDPNLQGTVRISVQIDTLGKIKSTKIVEKTLPEPVAQCMLKAVKNAPLPEASKCPGKSLTIPATFPTPH